MSLPWFIPAGLTLPGTPWALIYRRLRRGRDCDRQRALEIWDRDRWIILSRITLCPFPDGFFAEAKFEGIFAYHEYDSLQFIIFKITNGTSALYIRIL
jgi:hypothetical protein